MFRDRKDAGEQLANALEKYKDQDVLVLAIPKGGVAVAYYVARHLNAELDVVIVRKLGFPLNPEAAFGAIAEDGSVYISTAAYKHLSSEEIHSALDKEKHTLPDLVRLFRRDNPVPSMIGKTVILVDDGIATGATMYVAIDLCKRAFADRIIVASPVVSDRIEHILAQRVNEVIILEKPDYFSSVSEAYDAFPNVTEHQVHDFLREVKNDSTHLQTW